jgi:hypothetical protein
VFTVPPIVSQCCNECISRTSIYNVNNASFKQAEHDYPEEGYDKESTWTFGLMGFSVLAHAQGVFWPWMGEVPGGHSRAQPWEVTDR